MGDRSCRAGLRTGASFDCHLYGIEPDLVTVAKGLTSGYMPLSAAIVSEKIVSVTEDASGKVGLFSHGYTYSDHLIATASCRCCNRGKSENYSTQLT